MGEITFNKNKENKENKQSQEINKKINKISGILWINLDISKDRKHNMKKILSDITIPNYRVRAVDGINFNIVNNFIDKKNSEYINLSKNLKNSEFALTLSHFKVFHKIRKLEGEYFMVCEDDISLENIKYFKNIDLKKIIEEAPKFDILTLYKTKLKKLKKLYTDINSFNSKEKFDHIWGSVAYIITKNFAKDMCEIIKYNKSTKKFTIHTKVHITPSDNFIYSFGNSYTYKYNFISTNINNSLIHSKKKKS